MSKDACKERRVNNFSQAGQVNELKGGFKEEQ
jgi:hypothetical protein